MGTVLAGAEDGVNGCGRGIVAADGLGELRGEPEPALHEGEAVRPAQGSELDDGQRLVRGEINDRDGVEGAEAVIGDVGAGAVRAGDDLVGVVADGDSCNDPEGRRIDDGERVGAF